MLAAGVGQIREKMGWCFDQTSTTTSGHFLCILVMCLGVCQRRAAEIALPAWDAADKGVENWAVAMPEEVGMRTPVVGAVRTLELSRT